MKQISVTLLQVFLLIVVLLWLIFWYFQFFGRWFILLDRYSDLYINADKSWFDIVVYPKNQNFIITDIKNESYGDGNRLTVYAKLRYFLSENHLLDAENKVNKTTIKLSENEILKIYVLDGIFGGFSQIIWSEQNISLGAIKNKLQSNLRLKDFWFNQINELLRYQPMNIPLRLRKISKLLTDGDYATALDEYEFLKKITVNTDDYNKLFWDFHDMQWFLEASNSEHKLNSFFVKNKGSIYFDLWNIYYDIWNELYNKDNRMRNLDAIMYSYVKAISYFDRAITLDPNFSDAYKMKWIVLMDIGVPYKISQWVLEKAIETNPNNAYAYYKLWNIYREMADNKKAMEKYLKAISIEENEKYYFNLWSVQIKLWLVQQWLESRKRAYSICKESCVDIANTTLSNLLEYRSYDELKRIAEKAIFRTQDEQALGYYYLSKYYSIYKQYKLSNTHLIKAEEAWIKKFLK